MAGLGPAIHVFLSPRKDVDARVKPGHDGGGLFAPRNDGGGAQLLALMPASLMTFSHLARSPLIFSPISAGELPTLSRPSWSRRSIILASESTVIASLCTLSMIACGVPAGAIRPNQ